MLQEQRRELDVKIAEVIENIAREQKYAMVLNPYLTLPVSGNRTLTHNILLFADPSADITGKSLPVLMKRWNWIRNHKRRGLMIALIVGDCPMRL